MNIRRRRRPKSGMNIFPLVDVVLLLLIFFMLTSKFVTQTSHSITLPKSTTAKKLEKEPVVVHITKDRKIFLNEEKQNISLFELRGRLEHEFESYEKTPNVVIKGDEKIYLGLLMQVLDSVKLAGGENVNITTIKTGD